MSSRTKRRLEEFDPNKSDSDDLDYGDSSPPKRSGKSKKSSNSKKRKPAKRPRRAYDSEDDEDLGEESSEISQDSFAEDTPEEAELNPRTGRRVRGAAKKNVKYEEVSEEEIEETGNSDNDSDQGPTSHRTKPPSLVIKLRATRPFLRQLSSQTLGHPPRSRGRSGPTPPSSDMVAITRRSSRLSNDNTEPPIELTDSGKHAQLARSRTTTPDAPPRRSSRAAKGLKKPPSTIIEASQEQSGTTKQDDDEILMENEQSEGEDAIQASASDSPAQDVPEEGKPEEEQRVEDAPMAEAEVQDSAHGEDEDDDDEPVRAGRILRVSHFHALSRFNKFHTLY